MKEDNEVIQDRPKEAQVNDMYRRSLLDFHADAQAAKQNVNRRYARIVNHFGNYKQVPKDIQHLLRQEYAHYEAKWGENGEEIQKRFGEVVPDDLTASKEEYSKAKQEFVEQMKTEREQQRNDKLEYSR